MAAQTAYEYLSTLKKPTIAIIKLGVVNNTGIVNNPELRLPYPCAAYVRVGSELDGIMYGFIVANTKTVIADVVTHEDFDAACATVPAVAYYEWLHDPAPRIWRTQHITDRGWVIPCSIINEVVDMLDMALYVCLTNKAPYIEQPCTRVKNIITQHEYFMTVGYRFFSAGGQVLVKSIEFDVEPHIFEMFNEFRFHSSVHCDFWTMTRYRDFDKPLALTHRGTKEAAEFLSKYVIAK